jgi:hypothetical protein
LKPKSTGQPLDPLDEHVKVPGTVAVGLGVVVVVDVVVVVVVVVGIVATEGVVRKFSTAQLSD